MKQKFIFFSKDRCRVLQVPLPGSLTGAAPGVEWADFLLRPLLAKKLALLPRSMPTDPVYDTNPMAVFLYEIFFCSIEIVDEII
jgi:hypothetical protein